MLNYNAIPLSSRKQAVATRSRFSQQVLRFNRPIRADQPIRHRPAGWFAMTALTVLWRTTMLSPHEFATLLLVKDAPHQVDMNREELDALLERQLVELERLATGLQRLRVTETGDTALRAIKRHS
jgi:hypothetical protein